jgi:UPF0716 protein FxsA
MPILLLLALFIAVPILELYVIIQVGDAIGILPTLALLVVDSVLGTILLRSQGRAAWRRFTTAAQEGRVPHREALDGALVIFGGALLLTPGFVTDVVGLLLLIPPTRAIARRLVAALVARRLVVGVMERTVGRGPRRSRTPYDVDGTAIDVDEPAEPASRRRLEP